jgi:DNA-directed RNA polymerase sigma subunit (sigma70/sigma32)
VSSSDEDDASSSSTSSTTPADVPSTLLQLNTQEDDWTRQPPERSVAPLRDVFTDTEEINNPLSYTHHFILNEELNQFLCETLSTVELEVIQLRFGLVDSKYGGRGWSAQDIGERVGMEREEVVKVASVALEKLRQAAAADDDAFVEVSL